MVGDADGTESVMLNILFMQERFEGRSSSVAVLAGSSDSRLMAGFSQSLLDSSFESERDRFRPVDDA